jgi:hypothetical protein
VKEEGGYNIMKEQASQEAIKSTFILVNGGKIIKWYVVTIQEAIKSTFVLVNGGKIIKWCVATIQMEALHNYGD